MQNRGVIPLFISASRLGPNLCLYYPEDLRQTFIYWPRPPFSTPATELRMPPPRASVPVWADLHRATMHVAGAVASQRWDRPAQKRSLLRQHMAIEECGLLGGRSSTCVVVAARVSPRHRKQQMYRNLDLFFYTNEQTRAEDAQPKIHKWAFGEEIRAHLLNWFTCCWTSSGGHFQSREQKKDPPSWN